MEYQLNRSGDYFVVTDAAGTVMGRLSAKGRVAIGTGTDFFLLQEGNKLVAAEIRQLRGTADDPGRVKKGESRFLSRELGRYSLDKRRFLGLGNDFFVVMEGRWLVSVDKSCSGMARDLDPEMEFMKVERNRIHVRLRGRIVLYNRELEERQPWSKD